MRARGGFLPVISVILSGLYFGACASSPSLVDHPKELPSTGDGLGDGASKTPVVDSSNRVSSRSLSVDANAEELRPTAKVVLVVDNSNSMRDEQVKLANGVRSMIDGLKSHKANVNFYIYTTTPLANASSKPIVTKSLKHVTFDNNMNEVISNLRPAASNPAMHTQRETWDLTASLKPTSTTLFALKYDDSDSIYDSVRDSIANFISSIGVTGADSEEGFCNIGRILAEPLSAQTNGILSTGDHAAFIIISDADDNSEINSSNACLKKREQDFSVVPLASGNTTSSVKSESGQWNYSVQFAKKRDEKFYLYYSYNTTGSYDGQTRPIVRVITTEINPAQFGSPAGTNGLNAPCNQQMIDEAKRLGGASYVDNTCSYKSSFTYDLFNYSYVDTNVSSANLCNSSFVVSGVTYSSLYDYFRRTAPITDGAIFNNKCTSAGLTPYKPMGAVRNSLVRELIAPTASASLQDAIIDRSNKMFGSDGYFFSAVIDNDLDADDCSGVATERAGTKYRTFIERLGTRGSIHSICANTYYPALQKLSSFIQQVALTSYDITIESGETIKKVSLLRGSSTIDLEIGNQVTVVGPSLRFAENQIQPQDKILLTIEKIEN